MNYWLETFRQIHIADVLDIAFISFLIYLILVWFKKTRAAFVLTGIVIAGIVYLLARQFHLVLTVAVFQGFFTIILVAIVVIFQEEIRHFFERVAVWGLLNRRFQKIKDRRPFDAEVAVLVRTLTDLSESKTGAIVVLKGRDTLARHLEGGVELNGQLSEPLLKSIFDPHSIGHDGAVVIDQDQVLWFGCYLPLSKNFQILKNTGTRHAASLGLSELSDALCLVVSEESGVIAFAQNGELERINKTAELKSLLDDFYAKLNPRFSETRWKDFFRTDFLEKIVAIILAIALWVAYRQGN